MVSFFLVIAMGCQEGPGGDPEFKKEKVDPTSNQPVKDERMQEAPEA